LLVLEKGAADDDDDDDGERTKRRVVNLGGKNSVSVAAGDILRILSPGGGGYGEPSD
jgi:5-oxoprolinase (ATP-hydrolysing)